MELTAVQCSLVLDFARQAIRSALGDDSAPTLADPPADPVFQQRAGCFVSLHTRNTHRLRGCVGRLDTNERFLHALQQASHHVLRDPRFAAAPVRADELPELELEVTIILPLRPAEHCLDFDLLEDGIYLIIADRAGCFLPQVARDTGWTREQLLARLCMEKLGLAADAWQAPEARLLKFRTILLGPEPCVPCSCR